MSNNVTLSLPLSATALRLGATLLTDLAAQTETIYAELTGMNPFYVPNCQVETYAAGLAHADGLGGVQEIQPEQFGVVETTQDPIDSEINTRRYWHHPESSCIGICEPGEAFPTDELVEHIDAETYGKLLLEYETPEEKQYRLHGNVSSSGQEPAPVITQETLPPVEYETVVTGYAPGPTPFADGHDQASYEAAGWDIAALLNAGHLVEVTEQRPLPVAPGASAAPSAPAPAPAPAAPAPTGSGVAVDKDGLPWDSRIHSDAAEKLAKTGYWKTKKNLPDGYKLQIEAELKAVMNAGKPGAAASVVAPAAPLTDPNAASGAPAPVTATTATAAPTPAAPPAPSAAPAPAPAPSPAPAAATAGNPFAEFTRWLVTHTKSGKLSQTDAVLEIQKQGLTQIPDLAKRPDLIPAVMAALTAAKGL